MVGIKKYSWIRVEKKDKERMERYFKRKGVTNHLFMFKALLRGKK